MDAQKLFYDKARCREMTPDEVFYLKYTHFIDFRCSWHDCYSWFY